jgi:hypothetical protein
VHEAYGALAKLDGILARSGHGLHPLSERALRQTRSDSAVITLYLPSSFTLSAPLLSTPESLVVSAPLLAGTQSVTTDSLDFYLHNFLIVAGSWRASQRMPGSSGTLTLTEATADRVAGTFSFTAVATAPGVIPAARTVTAGSFDTSR